MPVAIRIPLFGVPKILRAMRRNGSPDPVFVSSDDRLSFEVHLPVHERAEWGGLLDTPQMGEQVSEQVGEQVSEQVPPRVEKLLVILDGELQREELQVRVDIRSRPFFIKHYLAPAIEAGLVAMTDPDSPNSPQQRYCLTQAGQALRDRLGQG